MKDWHQYIPPQHTILWIYAAIIVTWKITPFLRAMREACSEPPANNERGKVSRKRIIPLLLTALLCYMVIGSMHDGKPIDLYVFYGILGYIALDTGVVYFSQISSLVDKVSGLKTISINEKKSTEITTNQ